jgi:hypothetical protein
MLLTDGSLGSYRVKSIQFIRACKYALSMGASSS